MHQQNLSDVGAANVCSIADHETIVRHSLSTNYRTVENKESPKGHRFRMEEKRICPSVYFLLLLWSWVEVPAGYVGFSWRYPWRYSWRYSSSACGFPAMVPDQRTLGLLWCFPWVGLTCKTSKRRRNPHQPRLRLWTIRASTGVTEALQGHSALIKVETMDGISPPGVLDAPSDLLPV